MARKGKKRRAAAGDVATNRQAGFRYDVLERVECGIQLQGSEVKSLREGAVQLKDAYAEVRDGELWLQRMHIAPYKPAARENHDPERPRKLLLHRGEIERLVGKTAERGLTRVYFKGPHAKVEIALARGRERHDKRRAIREREQKREIERALSERY
jgi:SsrA-binding protein